VGRDSGIWHAGGGLCFLSHLVDTSLPTAEAHQPPALTFGVPLMAVSTAASSRRADSATYAQSASSFLYWSLGPITPRALDHLVSFDECTPFDCCDDARSQPVLIVSRSAVFSCSFVELRRASFCTSGQRLGLELLSVKDATMQMPARLLRIQSEMSRAFVLQY
jgi:hypothetical protein